MYEEILKKTISITRKDCIILGDFDINLFHSFENNIKSYINPSELWLLAMQL